MGGGRGGVGRGGGGRGGRGDKGGYGGCRRRCGQAVQRLCAAPKVCHIISEFDQLFLGRW